MRAVLVCGLRGERGDPTPCASDHHMAPTVGSWQVSMACSLQTGYGHAASTAPLAESALTLSPRFRSRGRCPTCSEACRAGTASIECTQPLINRTVDGRSPEAFALQEHQRCRRNASERHHPREPLLAHGANESVRLTHSRALSASRPLAAARPHAAIGTSRC